MSTRRAYNLGRRAETAAETRQRLVEATASLHHERGVAGTSLKDVAERAGVSVGTAYHHFPAYVDAVRACAAHHAQIAPLPPESIFDGIKSVNVRVEVLLRELGGWYEQQEWLERIRAERTAYAPIEESMAYVERAIERLARVAARCTADEARTIAALIDVAVYNALRRAGMSSARAHSRMAEAVIAWLRSRTRR